MTDEEKKAIKEIERELTDEDRKEYMSKWFALDLKILLNLIQKQKEEIEKKDKIINSIKEYAQQEIDFATEDIRDYIDDDKESNKNIIGELKEWREHWKDIIRIMNNEKTYMNFEYKV